jgi:hypothetical protein
MLSCTIDAHKDREIVTVDVPGACMHAKMDKVLYMKVRRPLGEIIVIY